MGGLGIDSAGAVLGEVVLMRGECMVLHRSGENSLKRMQNQRRFALRLYRFTY
jgi:hypothetical protein